MCKPSQIRLVLSLLMQESVDDELGERMPDEHLNLERTDGRPWRVPMGGYPNSPTPRQTILGGG